MAESSQPRSFDADADLATVSHLPIPRGVAFRVESPDGSNPTLAEARTAVSGSLPGWKVTRVEGMDGWFSAAAPADPRTGGPPPLPEFWERVRATQAAPDVEEAEPLLLVAGHEPGSAADAPFAMGFGPDQFGLWGWPYDAETAARIARDSVAKDWHLTRLNVRAAWDRWRAEHPGRVPGDGVVVGHPDTGYTDHAEVLAHLLLPGESFLRGEEGSDGRDDLRKTGLRVLQHPGHGAGTASVIASAEAGHAFGVAPGAKVLPLRVSRSVIHFDFESVGRAIGRAVKRNVDVISMSLGGPLKMTFVHRAIQEAQRNGVIVVAAAGNMIPSTVFPAAFPEVIAAAATHAANAPWRYSGLGPYVDIAAPGEGVWRALSERDGDLISFDVTQGSGTSFATACVAGMAALWLSFHGGRKAIARKHYGGDLSLVPLSFQCLLAKTANTSPEFVRNGRHGAGIADADALLAATLPDAAEVRRFASVVRAQKARRTTFLSGLFSGWRGLTDHSAVTLSIAATLDADGGVRSDPAEATEAALRSVEASDEETQLLRRVLGERVDELLDELLAVVAADLALFTGFHRLRPVDSLLPLFDRLLAIRERLSPALREQLARQRTEEERRLAPLHRGRLVPGVSLGIPEGVGIPAPPYRQLRAYAFDPSLATQLRAAPITTVTIPTRWEEVRPGPVGEYLEVIDIDPASGCAYSPVDLNHPHLLGQDGLAPSEGDPRFHQQMVYAVAMNTIDHFEQALGRPVFWSPLRPRPNERPEEQGWFTREARDRIDEQRAMGVSERDLLRRDRYVQRLRVHPHALREANAYYSPRKRALLFGYFPANDDDTGKHFPGGMVFTCLSHDIVAHETTHALLDGMHPFFNEPTNEDVWAFHEAFADIMALFQHFTYPEVLRHQIAVTRGNLEAESLLGELAQQFGQATGGRGALRSALGTRLPGSGWQRHAPDPRALRNARAPHERGSILVAAVFDAFIAIYNNRVADLQRISTGGTGVFAPGNIHPDLVYRLANEAAGAAEDVLRACIRAMDYVPPVDITFGEFLRALITADYDLSTGERSVNRVAFIEAFRSWGIYPRDVPTLSEDSLRWHPPDTDTRLQNLTQISGFTDSYEQMLRRLGGALERWQPGSDRADIFVDILDAQRVMHYLLRSMQRQIGPDHMLLPGLDLRGRASFSVGNLRPARRVGPRGEFRTEMVVEVVQRLPGGDRALPFRGGSTLIVDMQTWDVRYVIYKRLFERLPTRGGGRDGTPAGRSHRQAAFAERQRAGVAGGAQAIWQGEDDRALAERLASVYAPVEVTTTRDEPFALMHRGAERSEHAGYDGGREGGRHAR
ncbi:MAG TPA: S8 family serine peptidase, partial [Thermomicrobiales bacterium]|nr:S8 family serine peptidase [Thermomicrobiales bacterium]